MGIFTQVRLLLLMLSYFVAIDTAVVPGNGTFFINGIFQLTNEEGNINYQTGIMMSEAMKYAIQTLNKKQMLHGYKIDTFSFKEDCQTDDDVHTEVLRTYLLQKPFIVGPFTSELSYITNILTGLFRLATVSYSATYTDFGREKFMMRTVPSDSFRIKAAIQLIEELQWNYFAVVSSHGYNGERDASHFVSKILEQNVCISTEIDLPSNPEAGTFLKVINKISNDKDVKAIVMFTINKDSRQLLRALKKCGKAQKFHIICVYGCSNYKEVTEDIEEVASGVISLDLHAEEVPGFKDYFLNQKPNLTRPKAPFSRFWEKVFNCTLEIIPGKQSCTGKEKMAEGRGYFPLTPVHTVINAVSSIAKALQITITDFCDANRIWMQRRKTCIIAPEDLPSYAGYFMKVLRKFEFKSNKGTLKRNDLLLRKEDFIVRYDIHSFLSVNGSYQNVHIGSWEMNQTNALEGHKSVLKLHHQWHLANGSHGRPVARCSNACAKDHVRKRDTSHDNKKCCWTCSPCPTHHIVENNTCVKCKHNEMANIEKNQCAALPVINIRLSPTAFENYDKTNLLATLFAIACIIGLVLIIIVVAFFIKYNHYRMVRASGRELCYMILFGVCLLFLCPFLFFAEPSLSSCLFRNGLPGIGFLTCYAPLFLKTHRIYRIFRHAKKSVSRPILVNSRSMLLLSFAIVSVQILIIGVWFLSKVPIPEGIVSKDRKYITMHCLGDSSPILLTLNVALSVLFMILCTFLAFKMRHYPKNYNEAKYIGITLYTTCVAWAIFVTGYFLMPVQDYSREFFMCGICVVIGYITLFGLFWRKIRLLIWQDKLVQEATSKEGSTRERETSSVLSSDNKPCHSDFLPHSV